MSSALLILVHGSPRPSANDDMFRVLEEIRKRGSFSIVKAGFLECNTPSIPEAIDQCVELGADVIVAVPYFLHTGSHVADDLPGLLEEGQNRHPQIKILMGKYLGESSIVTDILADRYEEVKAKL